MRVEKIGVLFVIIQLQIFMSSSATTTTTTVDDELKSNNSLALKMIRKLTRDSNVKKVLDNLDVNVEKVLETLGKCPDIRLTRVVQTIKWACEEYLENPAKYCEWSKRPRSDELKGGQCITCSRRLKLRVAICEIDPMISFCKMIPELPIPEQIHSASDYMKDVLVSDWTYDGTEAIFPESVWSDYRRKVKENLCGVSASRRQDGKLESKNDFGNEDINPKTGDICKDQHALNDELNEL